jgi:hypothetical protein
MYLHGVLLFAGTFLAYSISSPPPFLDLSRGKFKHRKINSLILISILTLSRITLLPIYPSGPSDTVWTGRSTEPFLLHRIFHKSDPVQRRQNGISFKKHRTCSRMGMCNITLLSSDLTGSLLLFINRFLFVLALSIVIDIRDIASDGQKRIITIPAKAGILPTKIICRYTINCRNSVYIKKSSNGIHSTVHLYCISNQCNLDDYRHRICAKKINFSPVFITR